MHKIVAGIALLLLISGCQMSDDAQSIPGTTSRMPIKLVKSDIEYIPDGPGSKDVFIATLQKEGVEFKDRDVTAEMGRTVCASLQRNAVLGADVDSRVLDRISRRITKGTEFEMKQTGVIIGASISAFCPEFAYLAN
ncbi:DUF732 domain-containing protein [Nocardia sp. NPDC051030]|uniref:DUF732 domain-containing protein n=1 Tax=Nocardia sp. NPDC051030 TaxID=3155162 RepID=UPI003438212F